MGKVIAIGPGGKPQAPERTDHFRPVIDTVRSLKLLDQLLISPAVARHEQADDMRRGLYRSARYYCSCGNWKCTRQHNNIDGCPDGGQRISCRADVVRVTSPQGKPMYAVQFRLHDKQESMRHVIARYGPDPNQWPYFSKRKRKEK